MAKDNHRTIHMVGALVFTIAAVVHLLRLVNGWQLVIGNWSAPMWLSGVGVLLAGTLAVLLWRTR